MTVEGRALPLSQGPFVPYDGDTVLCRWLVLSVERTGRDQDLLGTELMVLNRDRVRRRASKSEESCRSAHRLPRLDIRVIVLHTLTQFPADCDREVSAAHTNIVQKSRYILTLLGQKPNRLNFRVSEEEDSALR